jgi:putative glutathione S-transferase
MHADPLADLHLHLVSVPRCYFKTNAKRIADYPNLLGFVRDVYAMDGVTSTTNPTHIKMHYYTSHPSR